MSGSQAFRSSSEHCQPLKLTTCSSSTESIFSCANSIRCTTPIATLRFEPVWLSACS